MHFVCLVLQVGGSFLPCYCLSGKRYLNRKVEFITEENHANAVWLRFQREKFV